jgi:hypothetical protein
MWPEQLMLGESLYLSTINKGEDKMEIASLNRQTVVVVRSGTLEHVARKGNAWGKPFIQVQEIRVKIKSINRQKVAGVLSDTLGHVARMVDAWGKPFI